MLRTLRTVIACAIAGVAFIAVPAVARAGGGNGSITCDQNNPQPGCTVGAGSGGQTGGTAGGGGGVLRGDGRCYKPDGAEIACEREGAWAGSDGCYYKPEDLSADTIAALGGQP